MQYNAKIPKEKSIPDNVVRVVESGYYTQWTARTEHSTIQYDIPDVRNYYRIAMARTDLEISIKEINYFDGIDNIYIEQIIPHFLVANKQPNIITFYPILNI